MTLHFTTPLYAVAIPKEFQSILDNYDDVRITESVFADLNRLSTLVPLNDIFHLIYEQMENASFVQFINQYGLKSILQLDTNITWMKSVASQFDTYLLDRKAMDKNKETPVSYRNNSVDTIHQKFKHVKQIGKDDIILGFFEYFDDADYKDGKIEIDETEFKDNLFNVVYDYLGYDALRRHGINKYLLRIGL